LAKNILFKVSNRPIGENLPNLVTLPATCPITLQFFATFRTPKESLRSEMLLRLLLRSLTWDVAGKDYNQRAVTNFFVLRRGQRAILNFSPGPQG
jgi:hypothetical protein